MNKGNILFTILIAIALFALLGSVIMSGDSANNKLTEDKARLYAQDIVDYAQALENAVQHMLNEEISENLLCFDYDAYPGDNADYEHTPCNTAANRVFHGDGGGVRYRTPKAEYFDTAYSGQDQYGTYFITGDSYVYDLPLGSGATRSELIMFVPGLKKNICIYINNILNVGSKDDDPPFENSAQLFENDFFTGSFAQSYEVGGTVPPLRFLEREKRGLFFATCRRICRWLHRLFCVACTLTRVTLSHGQPPPSARSMPKTHPKYARSTPRTYQEYTKTSPCVSRSVVYIILDF